MFSGLPTATVAHECALHIYIHSHINAQINAADSLSSMEKAYLKAKEQQNRRVSDLPCLLIGGTTPIPREVSLYLQ